MRNRIAILIGCGTFVLLSAAGFAADDFNSSGFDNSEFSAKVKSAKARKQLSVKNQDAVKEVDKLLFGDLDDSEEELQPLPTTPKLKRIPKRKKIAKTAIKETDSFSVAHKKKKSSLIQADFENAKVRKKSSIVQVKGPETESLFILPDEESESSDDSPLILLLPENEKAEENSDVLNIDENQEVDNSEESSMLDDPVSGSLSQGIPAAGTGVQNPSVSLQWVKRSAVNIGQKCECDLVVKNTGKTSVKNVDVDAFVPRSLRIVKVTPQPIDNKDHLTWKFKTLEPGQEEKIQLQMIPSAKGNLGTTAYVRFTGAASEKFEVREPKLVLNVKGPKKAIVGELASQIIVISNQGDGVATDIVVQALIPSGLVHARGKKLNLEIGSLEPGESRNIRLSLEASEGGTQRIDVKAKANAVPVQTASSEISVIAPHLKTRIDGPGLRFVGRKAQYNIQVANDGQGVSNNVRILYSVPEGFEFVRADRGGKYDDTSNNVQWFIGRLGAEEARQVRIELIAKNPGDFVHKIAALSENGNRIETELKSSIEGSASLVLEIIDLDDPVEVGSETAYEVRIKNEGSALAKNVNLVCEMPGGVNLLEAKGPTRFLVNEEIITFKSVSELKPGKTAVYRVHVKGSEAGNKRFRVKLTSDSIDEPLIFEELTKFYSE